MTASPAFPQTKMKGDLAVCDPVWSRLRSEAEDVLRSEPQLASFIVATVLNHPTLEGAVSHRVAARLGHPSLPAELIAHAFHEAIQAEPEIGAAFRADIGAVIDRDPATLRALEPVLYFKGFHALEAHRLAHHVWTRGRRDLALYLQSRVSEVFQCDIHPAARIGGECSSTTPPASWSAPRR